MIAIEPGAGLEPSSIRTAAWLGQRIARDLFHGHEVGQVFRFDLIAGEAVDHPRGHVVDRDERTGRGAAIGHGFHDQRGFEAAEADAARFLADVDRTEAELRALLDHIDGKVRLFIPFTREGRDVVGGEALRHFLDRELFFGELELSCIRRHGA